MSRQGLALVAAAWLAAGAGWPAELRLTSPVDYQVIQRHTPTEGTVLIRGSLMGQGPDGLTWQARVASGSPPAGWDRLAVTNTAAGFSAALRAPAGGWYRIEVRALLDGQVVAETAVEHVGVGEVFVVAGQSNSANHGEERQRTQTRRVAAWDVQRWQLADDPQPGASGEGGSFLPPLGDELVRRFNVPVGFVACGIGATSVREWLPAGAAFPNPPTIEARVEQLPSGEWASKGEAYRTLIGRMKALGVAGFRAVLWHQGESDANQHDPTRTLPGNLYRTYLEQLIRDSRRDVGWEVPWFVAQVSYHVPGDEASADIREAQASLWRDGVALEGPDSDALKGELREARGQGVHFSGPGLREHGRKWAEKVGKWLAEQLLPRSHPEARESDAPRDVRACLKTGWNGLPARFRRQLAAGRSGGPPARRNRPAACSTSFEVFGHALRIRWRRRHPQAGPPR